jgi:4-hydroxybenzoate polyprenyltransferase
MDFKEDRKDKEKAKWKFVAGGILTPRTANTLAIIFLISGLSVSFFVNKWFFLIMVTLIFLNFLHSLPLTKFKKNLNKTSINITVIEFLKYSCGWFALTSNLYLLPFWLILTFSIVYTTSYIIYKFKFKGKIIRKNKRVFFILGMLGGISYFISLIEYGFPLSMLLLFIIPFTTLIVFKQTKFNMHKINNMFVIEYLLLPLVIICFLMLNIPIIAEANEQIADNIDSYTEKISEEIPDSIVNPLKNISEKFEKYKSLDDIEREINSSLKTLVKP